MLAQYPEGFRGLSLPGIFTQKIIGIGEGSSYNALKIAAPFVEELTGLNTFTFDPESIEHKFTVAQALGQPVKKLFTSSYFLTVSQSGETRSIIRIVEKLQEGLGFANRYSPLLAITNNPHGSLGTRYGNHLVLTAGEERSIAATKSMTTSIMALLLFGLRLGKRRGWLKRPVYDQFLTHLQGIPDAMARVLQDEALHKQIRIFASSLASNNQFVLLSKGLLSTVLPELGLKLTETSSNIVWCDNTESFKHGRKVILKGVQGVRPNCIYVIPPDMTEAEAKQFFLDIQAHFYLGEQAVFETSGVFFVRFANSPAIPDSLKSALNLTGTEVLELPPTSWVECLFVTLAVFHLLSGYLAQAKGDDPNHPTLQKAVVD